ncbi:unnamed protein product [Clonostachys rosea f. rosea IK726]|uniref:Uncharacterized protein n=1 Tax=Clonostachys rosea f. rosea IK726 TaxID=1349383 RepID=A0ACA9U160_BIOOC|nr:unnamed protein product [Clonostachys rosea f. rosea IK726]
MLRKKRAIQATDTQRNWADATSIIHSVVKGLLDEEGTKTLGLFAALAELNHGLTEASKKSKGRQVNIGNLLTDELRGKLESLPMDYLVPFPPVYLSWVTGKPVADICQDLDIPTNIFRDLKPRNSLFISFAEVGQTRAAACNPLSPAASGIVQFRPIHAHCPGSPTSSESEKRYRTTQDGTYDPRNRRSTALEGAAAQGTFEGVCSLGAGNSVSTGQPDSPHGDSSALLLSPASRRFNAPSNVSLPDGSSLPIHYLTGQACTVESDGAEVGMCLRGHDDCQDLDTSSLGILSYAADLAQESPSGASLSTKGMLGPVPRSDIPHGQMSDNEQRQTKIYGGTLGTGYIDVGEAVESSLDFEDYFNLDPPATPPCGPVYRP